MTYADAIKDAIFHFSAYAVFAVWLAYAGGSRAARAAFNASAVAMAFTLTVWVYIWKADPGFEEANDLVGAVLLWVCYGMLPALTLVAWGLATFWRRNQKIQAIILGAGFLMMGKHLLSMIGEINEQIPYIDSIGSFITYYRITNWPLEGYGIIALIWVVGALAAHMHFRTHVRA